MQKTLLIGLVILMGSVVFFYGVRQGKENKGTYNMTVKTNVYEDQSLDDSLLWLEEIRGEKPLNWARQKSADTLKEFSADPRFLQYKAEAIDILTAQDRIAYGRFRGEYIYNFWRDKTHVRGLWRRASRASYKAGNPQWETVLDVDALAETEGENWIWKGANCLAPAYERCLVSLAPGGTDAAVYREFDIPSKSFIDNGFSVPLAKSRIAWEDQNNVLVATDFGPDSLTESGYARIVKRWQRGTQLSDAKQVFVVPREDMMAIPYAFHGASGSTILISRRTTIFGGENWLMDEKARSTSSRYRSF